ncbi:MAG: hypothetical protein AB6733_20735 [Clostridiaceae bacterium]
MKTKMGTWLRWKLYIRLFNVFKSSNILKDISYKQRAVLMIVFSLFRDLAIFSLVYLISGFVLNYLKVDSTNFLSVYILLQLVPDFTEAKKTWRWELFSVDREWALACTPLNLNQLSKFYFMEEMAFKLYSYLTGLIPLSILIFVKCGVSLKMALLFSIALMIYKISTTFITNRVYNFITTWFMKTKTLSISFVKYIFYCSFFSFIGTYVGENIGQILNDAPFINGETINIQIIKQWLSVAFHKLKEIFTYPVEVLLSNKTPWTYTAKALIEGEVVNCLKVLLIIVLILFILNFSIRFLKIKEVEEDTEVVNTLFLERVLSALTNKIISIFKLDKHINLRLKLFLRHKVLAENPFILMGAPSSWILFGVFCGVLSINGLKDLLIVLLIIEVGIIMPKDFIKGMIKDLYAILAFDSDGINTKLYFYSPKEPKYLFCIKCLFVRILAIPGVIVRYLVVFSMGAFSLQQILIIILLCCLSIYIYSSLYLLSGLITPHFEVKNIQQIGTHSDQHLSSFGISILEFIIHDILRAIPILISIGWLSKILMYPVIIIASIVIFFIAYRLLDYTSKKYSSKVVLKI